VAEQRFDRYKAALRRGHVALLDDQLEVALTAYREAARIVPDRPLPQTSAAVVLRRLGRLSEALAALDVAVGVAADDETALRARASLLAELRRPSEAAADLDRVAVVLRSAGRPEAALEAARSAAGLDPSDSRRRIVEELELAALDLEGLPGTAPERPPEADDLMADAVTRLEQEDRTGAVDLMLQAVAVHRAAGRPDAALDAGFQLLALAPGDARVHLAIAGLQLDRGWYALAREKVQLLLRLTELTGDTQATADVHALAAERLRDESAGVAAGR
jgi:tetratricopeptide (TPR) repeat protein